MSAAGTIHLIKRGRVLVPADQHADEYIGKLKDGDEIVVKRQAVKNPKEVRWYFAMLREVCEQTEQFSNPEELREALMIETGYYVWHVDMHGRHRQVPKSLTELDLDEFREHKKLAMKAIQEKLGIDAEELMRVADGTQKVYRR